MDSKTFKELVSALEHDAFFSAEKVHNPDCSFRSQEEITSSKHAAFDALMRFGDTLDSEKSYASVRDGDTRYISKKLSRLERELSGNGTVLDQALYHAAWRSVLHWDKQQYLDRIAYIAGAAWDKVEKDHQPNDD